MFLWRTFQRGWQDSISSPEKPLLSGHNYQARDLDTFPNSRQSLFLPSNWFSGGGFEAWGEHSEWALLQRKWLGHFFSGFIGGTIYDRWKEASHGWEWWRRLRLWTPWFVTIRELSALLLPLPLVLGWREAQCCCWVCSCRGNTPRAILLVADGDVRRGTGLSIIALLRIYKYCGIFQIAMSCSRAVLKECMLIGFVLKFLALNGGQ